VYVGQDDHSSRRGELGTKRSEWRDFARAVDAVLA
jgi:hypothetical protein